MRTDLHFAVVIGIDGYPFLKNLSLARKDAVAFHHWLTNEAGVPKENTQLLSRPSRPALKNPDRSKVQPSRDRIWDAIWDKILLVRARLEDEPAAWVDTRLYVYFSGHGISPTASESSGLAADVDLDHYGNSASFKALHEWLEESHDFAQVVIIADCCRNVPPTGAVIGVPNWTPVRRSGPDVLVAELYATTYGDFAREPLPTVLDGAKNGYFTHAILEGLRGKAATNAVVTTLGLAEYAGEQVIRMSKGKQKAAGFNGASLVLSEVQDHHPIATAHKALERMVRLTFKDSYSGSVEIFDGKLRAVGKFMVVNGKLEQPFSAPGVYVVRPLRRGAFTEKFFPVDEGAEVLDVTI